MVISARGKKLFKGVVQSQFSDAVEVESARGLHDLERRWEYQTNGFEMRTVWGMSVRRARK